MELFSEFDLSKMKHKKPTNYYSLRSSVINRTPFLGYGTMPGDFRRLRGWDICRLTFSDGATMIVEMKKSQLQW